MGASLTSPPLLIAHRGGVVDGQRSENSFKALDEAVRRGYTHVEIDARITADGHVICFHNDTLLEEAGVDGRISSILRDEVTQVVLTRSGENIPTFEQYCARCAGRIGVMIDLKGCPDEFINLYADEIKTALAKHHLLKESLILINKAPRDNQAVIARLFSGMARVSWRRTLEETHEAIQRDTAFATDHYVFNHGDDFAADDIAGFQALGLPVIASINHQHYPDGDPTALGAEHIHQLRDWGIDGFQIDSSYDTELG